MHFISIKPVLSDHLSYVTIFHCSSGRSHKTGLIVLLKYKPKGNKSYGTKDKGLLRVKHDMITACQHWKAEELYIKSKCRQGS